jgi:hypothetical protein
MATSIATATAIIRGAPIQTIEASATPAYRLGKSLAAVCFDPAGKGRIVFLPQGAVLRVIGPSRLCECFEVLHDTQLYSVFKIDLLGPWSRPIQLIPSKAACA